MELSEFGSPSALSIVANLASSHPMASTIILGSFATVVAGEFICKEYANYQEKKHKQHIESVNRLHKMYLSNIEIQELHERLHLPPIFGVDPTTSAVTSMHFTIEQIECMEIRPTPCSDPTLMGYKELISSTILKLKEYYLKRKIDNDVTAGVLSWLLYILEVHCLNFQGYPIDIAFLNHIEKFISEYSSLKNTENSETFSWLAPADGCLIQAIKLLEKHRKSIQLKDMISELGHIGLTQANQLLRLFAKLVVKDKYHNFCNCVTFQELEQGILHQKRINQVTLGFITSRQKEKKIKSFYGSWIMSLSSYYLKSIGLPNNPNIPDIESPDILFQIPSNSNNIDYAFHKNINFITRLSEDNQLVEIKNSEEKLNRVRALKKIAGLIHQLISLHYLCTQLIKCFQQLGSIYVENPHHMQHVFRVIDTLTSKIINDAKCINITMNQLFEAFPQEKRIHAFRKIPNKIDQITKFIEKKVDDLNGSIQKMHRLNHQFINDPTSIIKTNEIKNKMLEIAMMLEKIYALPLPIKIEKIPQIKALNEKNNHSIKMNTHPSFHQLKKISLLLYHIQHKMIYLHLEKTPHHSLNQYLKLYQSLSKMHDKLITQAINRPNIFTTNHRHDALLNITYSICIKSYRFLQLKNDEQVSKAKQLAEEIDQETHLLENARHIDEHQYYPSKIAYQLFKCRFFQTDSRKKLSNISEAFKAIAHTAI